MELLVPGIWVILGAVAIIFGIVPRLGPTLVLISAAALLSIGIYHHYNLFHTEYRLATWSDKLRTYGPAVMIIIMVIFILGFIFTLFGGPSVPMPNLNESPVEESPVEESPVEESSAEESPSPVESIAEAATNAFNAAKNAAVAGINAAKNAATTGINAVQNAAAQVTNYTRPNGNRVRFNLNRSNNNNNNTRSNLTRFSNI
jgi:hypothetical protein